VHGIIRRVDVDTITTAANLTTILVDGIVEMPPGFIPVHNGTSWNYILLDMGADDKAAAFIPPSIRGTVKVMDDRQISTFGTASYDTNVPATAILAGGTDFEVTTGVLTGTTGTNDKITVSASTTVTGTHTGANNAAVLTDSNAVWRINEWVGETISNTTDGSTATVISNTATTITATLAGGTDNDWDTSDAYSMTVGVVYVEARKGNSDVTVLIESAIFGV